MVDFGRKIAFMRYWLDLKTEGTVANQLFGLEYHELLAEAKEGVVNFEDVMKMSSAYQKTTQKVYPEKLPRSFWINAFFFPQGNLALL